MDKVFGTKNYDAIEIKPWESEPELEKQVETILILTTPRIRSTWL